MTAVVVKPELAATFEHLAADVDADHATTYTSDLVYEAALQLRTALDRQLAAAEHIRGARRPLRPGPNPPDVELFGPAQRRRWWFW